MLTAFRRLQQLEPLECTCTTAARCAPCSERASIKFFLHRAFKLPPWVCTVEHPDEPCSYPKGEGGFESWPDAQQRYRALAAAVDAEIESDGQP
jgi:hypothetical protein